ncbi:GNAT family N-acetyltransferase [Roseibium alexandrii]|uniref:GNAT family N-acetyltransferase n=1 Tax=Roseibium alexandrii TaxID=388408 RepID=UPI0009E6C408|nr:GNAT family N-acetyltransferase [Roseibium alexandrii]
MKVAARTRGSCSLHRSYPFLRDRAAVFLWSQSLWLGYGAELSLAALDVADTQVQLPVLSALAHPENAGSNRLLEKVGFQAEHHVASMTRILYRRKRPVLAGN